MAETAHKIFAGTFTHAIDNQNRITVPSIWRGPKGSSSADFFVFPHPDKMLWVLPPSELEKLYAKLENRGMAERDTWQLMRVMVGRMQPCTLDSQGRLTIGDDLLGFAELKSGDSAVLVGLVKHFEIVKPERWQEWKQRAESDYADIAARVGL